MLRRWPTGAPINSGVFAEHAAGTQLAKIDRLAVDGPDGHPGTAREQEEHFIRGIQMANDRLAWLVATATAASLNSLQSCVETPLKIATLSSEYRGCLIWDPAIAVARAASPRQDIRYTARKARIFKPRWLDGAGTHPRKHDKFPCPAPASSVKPTPIRQKSKSCGNGHSVIRRNDPELSFKLRMRLGPELKGDSTCSLSARN